MKDWFYRARQFWRALRPSTITPQERDTLQNLLSPSLLRLFEGMSPADQAHSLDIYRRLLQQGENDPHLLVAALLHDVGKSRYPFSPLERVLVVLVQAFAPRLAQAWGQSAPRSWKRPFVVAAQHAEWGAQMAADAGASPLTVALIRYHQEALLREPQDRLEGYLRRLQMLDNSC